MGIHISGEQDGEVLQLAEVSSIPAPAESDKLKTYFKSGGVYIQDDAGNEAKIADALGGVPDPPGYLEGYRLVFTSVSVATLGTAGLLSSTRDSTDVFALVKTGTLTADISVSGAGGLQTGQVEAANTWYEVNVIGDTSGVNATSVLLIPEGVAFSEAGFDVRRRVACVRNNGSSNFKNFIQADNGRERLYFYEEDRSNVQPLVAGPATTFTLVDATPFIPPSSRHVIFAVGFDSANNGDLVDFRPEGSVINNPVAHIQAGTLTAGNAHFTNHFEMILPTRKFEYRITKGGAGTPDVDVFILGFVDSV